SAEADRLAQARPQSPAAHLLRGRASLLEGDLPRARAAFEAALRAAPGLFEAEIALLEVLLLLEESAPLHLHVLRLVDAPRTRPWAIRAIVTLVPTMPDLLAQGLLRLNAQRARGDARLQVSLGVLDLAADDAASAEDHLAPLLAASDLATA